MKNGKVFLNVCETLVKTRYLGPEEAVKPGWTFIQSGEHRLQTIVRPSSRAFLEQIRQYSPDVITSGGAEFQGRVLEVLGLRDLVGTIYGGESNDEIVVPGPWVMVTHHDGAVSGMMDRFRRLGIGHEFGDSRDERWLAPIERHQVRCEMFFGADDQQPLTDLLPLIEQKLRLQAQ